MQYVVIDAINGKKPMLCKRDKECHQQQQGR